MSTQDRRRPGSGETTRKKTRQDVVYTQAKAFNRKRFILQIATVVAVVLALLFGLSLFFKVDTVLISGTVKYDPAQIQDAAGILDGENLLTLNKDRIAANIQNELHYINEVQVGKKLPGTVVIHVTELDVTYAIEAVDGSWWLMSPAGKIVNSCSAADAEDYTRVVGVQLNGPVVGQAAVAYEAPQQPDENGQTNPMTVYAGEKLTMALSVIQNMEANGFIGSIAKVDVGDLGDIQLWYGTRFQMLLGDGNDLPKKLGALSQVIAQSEDHITGILDASYTIWTDGVGRTDFP